MACLAPSLIRLSSVCTRITCDSRELYTLLVTTYPTGQLLPRSFDMPSDRQPHRRARTGCLTCRSRRKKCDETRPRCTGCMRNGFACSWPSAKIRSAREQVSSGATTPLSDAPEPSLTTTWNPSLGAFVLSSNRAASLYPSSQLLLRKYLTSTASICTHLLPHVNPFITYVLPLATVDDLVMNVILALGGVHQLAYNPEHNSVDVYRDTYKHYALALQGLKSACSPPSSEWDTEKRVRVLLVLVLLAHVEVSLHIPQIDVSKAHKIDLISSRHYEATFPVQSFPIFAQDGI